MKKLQFIIPLAVAALALTACGGTDDSTTTKPAATADAAKTTDSAKTAASSSEKSGASSEKAAGAYIDYATYKADKTKYADTNTVLYFYASWCPSCTTLDKNLTDNGVPANLTIVKVDYDKEKDLKETHKVTQQHTFVKVDQDGKELKKWSGGKSGADIAKKAA